MNRLLFCLILCCAFNEASSNAPQYEIKALEGTFFWCSLDRSTGYPNICSGIIQNSDSTQLNIENGSTFFHSLFENAEYVQYDELFYAQAYNIIFPHTDDKFINYKLAQDLRMDFNNLIDINQNVENFKLATGENIQISFCKVMGLFLSIYDEEISSQFYTSMDVQKTLLPSISSVDIPLAIFSCSTSNHKFCIKTD